ncbi:MAG: hypothetical protein WCJ37_12525 [Syntrophus sp. (in: bacteria)]
MNQYAQMETRRITVKTVTERTVIVEQSPAQFASVKGSHRGPQGVQNCRSDADSRIGIHINLMA